MSKFDKALARHQGMVREQLVEYEEKLRELNRKARRANVRNGLLIAAIPGLFTLGAALIPVLLPPAESTPTYLCTESYERAIDMYQKDGVWIALPGQSEEEQYCDVNDRIVDLFDIPPGETVYLNPTP